MPRRIQRSLVIGLLLFVAIPFAPPASAACDDGEICGGGGNVPPPSLTIVTNVTNDDGGTKGVADFTAVITTVDQKIPVVGAGALGATSILKDGDFSVAPAVSPAYRLTTSGVCAGTVSDGQTAKCVLTYDDYGPHTPPPNPDPTPAPDPTPTGTDGTGATTTGHAGAPSRTKVPPQKAGAPSVMTVSATECPDTSASAAPAVQVSSDRQGGSCSGFWGLIGCDWWIVLAVLAAFGIGRRSGMRRDRRAPAEGPKVS